ncbi:hypothetical protein L1049_018418 [Liquidambar formosana]|uniref:PGG domain-containing protein n=1 Tax=Liquidambar formosana TaxID=63359 RepID=A0AAP0WLX3_LIQFO
MRHFISIIQIYEWPTVFPPLPEINIFHKTNKSLSPHFMDPRLSKAALLGDVVALKALLEEDPLILEKVALLPFAETPLHVAALAGKIDFVKEMISRKPSFARELNQDGFTPLHIAAAIGNIEIVRELLTLGGDLCLLKDKGGRNPLHYAAIKGRIDVIEELLSKCWQAIKEVTTGGESALHLAVKNNQFEALKVLVEKLECYDDGGEVMNGKDKEGNTILQLAVATKQLQVLDLLKNQTKLDKEIIEALPQDHQVESGTDIMMPQPSQTDKKITTKKSKKSEQADAQSTQDQSDSIWSEVEEMILVVASLIATVTYQAGLAPPQTIWKEDMKFDSKCIFHRSKHTSSPCPDVTYFLFMAFNTAGFFSAVCLIFFFRNKSTVQVLLPISLISMIATYMTLSITMSPNGLSLFIIYLVTLLIFVYCILAVEVVKEIVHSVFLSMAGKFSGILVSVRRKRKSSPADVAKEDP